MSDFQQATDKLQQWVAQQLAKGISKKQLYFYFLKREFADVMIDALLEGYKPQPETAIIEQFPDNCEAPQINQLNDVSHYYALAHIRLTKEQQSQQLKDSKLQLYLVPDVIESKLCEQLIIRSRRHFSPSKVVGQEKTAQQSGRTSATALVRDIAADAEKKLCQRIGALMGIDPKYCEPLQIQRYEQGQSYNNHADWFDESHPGFAESMANQGQRTWTCLIYLNADFEGGDTYFSQAKKRIKARTGSACIWNNLLPDGAVNTETYHAGLEVTRGEKYILTAWFRAKPE